jgi:hypothetical protein
MMKLTLAKAAKNNIKSKKAISGLFTVLTLFAILAGNSSFIAEGIGQTLEETRRAMLQALPIEEEITNIKISTPSRSMIRQADREMHLNMNAMIKALNSFHIGYTENIAADQEINTQFNQLYMINPALEIFENSDISLTHQFEAENINMNLQAKLLKADNHIFKQFYLNDYRMSNPSEITAGDILITDTFHTDNN